METKEVDRADAHVDVVDLGIASIETEGVPPIADEGFGQTPGAGITE